MFEQVYVKMIKSPLCLLGINLYSASVCAEYWLVSFMGTTATKSVGYAFVIFLYDFFPTKVLITKQELFCPDLTIFINILNFTLHLEETKKQQTKILWMSVNNRPKPDSERLNPLFFSCINFSFLCNIVKLSCCLYEALHLCFFPKIHVWVQVIWEAATEISLPAAMKYLEYLPIWAEPGGRISILETSFPNPTPELNNGCDGDLQREFW